MRWAFSIGSLASARKDICRGKDVGYISVTTVKEIAIDTIKGMPDDTTWDTIQDRINFMAGVCKGLRELDEEKGIPHDRVKEDFAKWVTR